MWAFCSLTWWKKSDYPEETTDLGQAIITLLHAGYRIRAVAWKSEGLNPALSRPFIIIWLRFLQTNQSFTFASWVYLLSLILFFETGRGSSIGNVSAWHESGPEFDSHVRHILSWRLGHENISTAILPLPLIQEEQLSVTGERMSTKYW